MNPYFEQMILGASPIELIRLLYQRANSAVRDAREHLANGRIAERSASITIAYMVLAELMSSLRPEEAPEFANRLKGLYCYMQQRLLDANLKQIDLPLAEVLGLLSTLAEAWAAVPEHDEQPPAKVNPWAQATPDNSARVALTA